MSQGIPEFDTPLGRLTTQHLKDQCAPFTEAYDRALELGAAKVDQMRREHRIAVCRHIVWGALNTKCAPRVISYQNALAADATQKSAASKEALAEAEGRLLYCARYPHPVDRDAVNPTPVSWYFKPASTQ